MIFLAALVTATLAFAIALLAVPVTTRMAWRFHMMDLPGRH